MNEASPALEAFVDETVRLAASKGYHPTAFIGMRRRFGTVEALSRLVESGDVQTGFHRLCQLGLREWTIEQAVLSFPDEFTETDRECAAFRLRIAGET